MSRRILRMRVENFLSIGEAEFDFEEAGFVLVEGENGAGKSTIVDALLWCLFGETLRGYRHDDVVNRRAGKDCVVTVDFVVPGEDEYRVGRARRHTKLKNSLCLYLNDVDVSGAGEKETQAEVERRLGCTFKTFMSSVVFGQNRAYRFGELTDAEQKQILDEVLGVERFAAACAAARKRVSATQAELDAGRRALSKAEEARDEAEAEAVDLEAKDADFAASQRKKVEAERDALAKVKRWLERSKVKSANELKETLDAAQHAVTLYERKLSKAVEADAAAVSALSEINARQAENAKLLRESDRLGGDCPTCGQKPTKRLVALIAETRVHSDELVAAAAEASKVRDVAATALGIARTKLKEARAAVPLAQDAYNDGLAAVADVAARRRRAAEHEAKIAELEREVNPYAELAEKARARHHRYDEEATGLADHVSELDGRLGKAQFWVKAFGNAGLRSLLIDSSLPLLNEEAARVSRVLTGGEISIEFSATSEQKSGKVVDRFEVRVDNRNGAGDYAGNSAGERAKVDLCVGLALQRLVASRSSASFNLAIFDEVFDHLSASAHEPVIEVLSELDKESVLVISHDDDLKAWFPATWRMVKRDGLSTIES